MGFTRGAGPPRHEGGSAELRLCLRGPKADLPLLRALGLLSGGWEAAWPRGRTPPILSPRITHMTRRPRRRRGRADRNFDSRTNGRWPGQAAPSWTARPATAARPGGLLAACWRRGRKRRPYGQNQLLTAQVPAVPFWGGARRRSPFICVSFQLLTQSPTDTPFLFVNVCVQQGRICTRRGPHVRKASVSPILYYSRSIFLLRANLRIRPCCSHTL